MCLQYKIVDNKPVPCGECFECRMAYTTDWAYRIQLEANLYPVNSFITLTYNNEHLPSDNQLHKEHLQNFFKRFRQYLVKNGIEYSLRYFACGEYGSTLRTNRPHYHLILFNWDFPDKILRYDKSKDLWFYVSPTLARLWSEYLGNDKKNRPRFSSYGFHSIQNVEYDTAKYVALYMQPVPQDGKNPPFTLMSRRPGIGIPALREEWLQSDKMYLDGYYRPLCRAFLNEFEKRGFDLTSLKERRSARYDDFVKSFSDDVYLSQIKRHDKLFDKFVANESEPLNLLSFRGRVRELYVPQTTIEKNSDVRRSEELISPLEERERNLQFFLKDKKPYLKPKIQGFFGSLGQNALQLSFLYDILDSGRNSP